MKKIILLLFLIQSTIYGQYAENSGHIWGKYSIGKIDSAVYNNYSIGGEIILKNRIGLNYNLDFIFRNDNIFQLHAPAGILGGPLLIGLGIVSWATAGDSNGDGEKDSNLGTLGIIGGILVLILPEGVSYHIPIKYHWDVAPYANILGIDWMRNKNSQLNYWRYASSFGTKITYWKPNNYTFSGFIETRKVAGMGWSIGGGVGLGYTIK